MTKKLILISCITAILALAACDGSALVKSNLSATSVPTASPVRTQPATATAAKTPLSTLTSGPDSTAQAETTYTLMPSPSPLRTSAPSDAMDYAALEAAIREYWGENIGAFGMIYYEIDTGRYIVINDQQSFQAASSIKVAICMAIYDMVQKGELDINSSVPYYDAIDADEGGGYEWYTDGESYPLQTLLYDVIVNSDNVAANLLLKTLGGDGHHYFIERISGTPTVYGTNIITPYQQFCVMNWLYHNPENNPYYGELIDNLRNTPLHDRIDKYIPTDLVAEKTGDYMGYANDIAIIYTSRPYILITLTDNVFDGHEMIAQTSKMIYDAHEGIKN